MKTIEIVCDNFTAFTDESGKLKVSLVGIDADLFAVEAGEICSTESIISAFTTQELLDEIGEEAAKDYFDFSSSSDEELDDDFILHDLERFDEEIDELKKQIEEKKEMFVELRDVAFTISNLEALTRLNASLKTHSRKLADKSLKQILKAKPNKGLFRNIWDRLIGD